MATIPSPYSQPGSHLEFKSTLSQTEFLGFEETYKEPEVITFEQFVFQYTVTLRYDPQTKTKSLLIEAEHKESKRLWNLRIDDALRFSNKKTVGPDTLFTIFKSTINNDVNQDSYSIEYPTKEKSIDSDLQILININYIIKEACIQIDILLKPVLMSDTELHQKQITHLKQDIITMANRIKSLEDTIVEQVNVKNDFDLKLKALEARQIKSLEQVNVKNDFDQKLKAFEARMKMHIATEIRKENDILKNYSEDYTDARITALENKVGTILTALHEKVKKSVLKVNEYAKATEKVLIAPTDIKIIEMETKLKATLDNVQKLIDDNKKELVAITAMINGEKEKVQVEVTKVTNFLTQYYGLKI